MAEQPESYPPLMWANGQDRNNVVVLTADTLYMATVKKAGLAAIDLGLEDGRPTHELLPARAWKLPLPDITRIQVKQVRSKSLFEEWMNKDVTVTYHDGRKERALKISLQSEAVRNELVQNLTERVGSWPFSEANLSPWLILARYLYILTVFALLTVFFCWLELSGQWHRPGDKGWFAGYFETCGVWGILVPGLIFCLVALLLGVWQLKTPPIIVTYQPGATSSEKR